MGTSTQTTTASTWLYHPTRRVSGGNHRLRLPFGRALQAPEPPSTLTAYTRLPLVSCSQKWDKKACGEASKEPRPTRQSADILEFVRIRNNTIHADRIHAHQQNRRLPGARPAARCPSRRRRPPRTPYCGWYYFDKVTFIRSCL